MCILVDYGGEIRIELAEPFEMILSTDGIQAVACAGDKEEPQPRFPWPRVLKTNFPLLVPLEGFEP